MNISLNGVTLDPNLKWINEFQSSAALQQIEPTLGGRQTHQFIGLEGARTIVLEATDLGQVHKGKFTRGQVEQFKALEKAQTEVTFVYGAESIQVVVQQDGVQVYTLIDIHDQSADAEYLGTLTLREV